MSLTYINQKEFGKLVILLVIALLFLICAVFAFEYFPEKKSTPKFQHESEIVFDTLTFDIGERYQGEKVNVRFVFTNIGQKGVILLSVKPVCGCTTVVSWSNKTGPDSIGTINVVFDTNGFQGPVLKLVKATFNDSGKKTVELWIKGVVRPLVDISPPFITFGTLKPGERKSRKIRVSSIGDADLNIGDVYDAKELFDSKLTMIEFGKKYEIIVRTRSEMLYDLEKYTLIMRVRKPRVIEIPISIQINQKHHKNN